MSPADSLNTRLRAAHPAAADALSPVGRRIYFPQGIPAQSAEAKSCAINATIGQLTNGHGGAMPLPAIAAGLQALPADGGVLYPPQGGNKQLRSMWRDRLAATAGDAISLPIVTNGLTHGLSAVTDLFVDADTDVILPDPCWGNYRLVFGVRGGGRLVKWRLLDGDRVDVDGLRELLASRTRKTVLVLNFPSNPLGFSPTVDEADAIVAALSACPQPLVVLSDDAYLGMVWEPDRLAGSLFDRVVAAGHERVLPVKVDGATKEFFFFGGRVGFLTFGVGGDAAAVLEQKAIGLLRSTVSAVTAPGQALVLAALQDPDLATHRATILSDLEDRYRRLRDGLAAAGVESRPFNAGFFVLLPTPGDPEPIRKALLAEGVGVVAFPADQALRVGYASVAPEDIPTLVAALARHLTS